jgi:hypothetical protein
MSVCVGVGVLAPSFLPFPCLFVLYTSLWPVLSTVRLVDSFLMCNVFY